MPGLVGFVNEIARYDAERLLSDMALALDSGPRFRTDLYAEDHLGLGRVSLGILNPEPQPIWDEQGEVCVLMDGELFNRRFLRGRLDQRSAKPSTPNDAELILNLYKNEGTGLFPELNGAFTVAIWNKLTNELVLANDRLGLYPLYFVDTGTSFAFAAGVRALMRFPGVSQRVDPTAIAEFLTFDHVLGQRSFLRDVELLPQGSILTFRDGKLEQSRYWRPCFREEHPIFDEQEYIERCVELMRQAVRRQMSDNHSTGLLLSGGLDSRMLLGLLAGNEKDSPITTFTFGIPGCDDARFAKEASRLAGATHYFFELKPNWMLEMASECVRITDGMGNLVNMHVIATLEQEAQYAQVLYKGFLGDAMFGFGMRPRYWADYSEADRMHVHMEAYRDYDVLTFDFPVHSHLFTDSFLKQVGTGILDDYRRVMNESQTENLSDQRIYIDFTQRVPRMTLNGVEGVRSRAAVRLPYADNDLVEFSLQIPPGLRLGRDLMVNAFIQTLPEYAQIPLTSSGLPLMEGARDVIDRAKRVIKWHLRHRGIDRLAGPDHKHYKNYDEWFRTMMRPWVEDVLLAQTCLNRGYFRPNFVKALVREHMEGANHAVQLGALLSLELWHREFLE